MDMTTPSVIPIENGKTDPVENVSIENGNVETKIMPEIPKSDQNEVGNEVEHDMSKTTGANSKCHALNDEKQGSQDIEHGMEPESKKRAHHWSQNDDEEENENYKDNDATTNKRARRGSENESPSRDVEKSKKPVQHDDFDEKTKVSGDTENKDDDDKSSTKKRVRRNSDRTMAAMQSSESEEPRQLRKRQPQTPSNSKSEKSETPIKSKTDKREKSTVSEPVPKNPKKKIDPEVKLSKKKKAASQRKQDEYDFDDDNTEELSTMPPLKHVHVDRGNFMEMKFTKAASEEAETPLKPKFSALSQSAEKRRRESSKFQRNSSPLKFTASSGSASQSSSRKKDSLSPGRTADISSSDSKQTGSTMPKSTPSSGLKASTDFSSNEKSPRKSFEKSMVSSGGKRVKSGSPSLFSDVEQKVCDDFDKEDFLSSGHQQPSRKTPSSTRRKQAVTASTSDEDSDMDDVKVAAKSVQHDASRSTSRKRGRPSAVERSMPRADVSSSDRSPVTSRRRTTGSLTPKPKQPALPQLTAEEQLNVDFPSSSTPHLLPGARVLAKWVDKSYYPAHIILDLGLGRYKVRFATDGFYKDMPAPAIVALARLKPGDKLSYNLHVGENDTELQPVEIKEVPSSTDSEAWFAGLFEVYNAITDTTEKISWEKFIIDEDNIKSFVKNLTNKAAFEIVADNISESRVRRNRGKRAESLEPEEETPAAPEKLVPRRRTATTTPKRTTRSPAVTKKSRMSHTDSPRPRPGTSSAQLVAAFDYAAAGQTISEESPESNIFDGIKFVLTSANRVRLTGSENSEEEKNLIPFNKKQIRLMIDQRGGLVVDEFTSLADTRDCFLIADQFYRTHKYLSALARAVPCVSHMWIHDCCSKETCLPYENYILPAGQSLETNQIIEWHNDCPTLLSGMRVFVYTENRPTNPGALDFVQIWAPLVRCMGATLVDDLPDAEDGNHIDILLTDISCPDHVLSKAAKLGAQAVSSEWLIQAIITGQRPQATAHQKYRYDFIEQAVTSALV